MKKLFYSLALLSVLSCSEGPIIDYPYTLIDSKSETMVNDINTMVLYTTPETINHDTLKLFCNEIKNNTTNGTLHYIVFFDSKENAVFPNNPITAFYGMDETPQKHIRAYFEHNSLNNYSKLHVYETNSWDSKATTYNL